MQVVPLNNVTHEQNFRFLYHDTGPAVLATSTRRHNNACPELEVKTGPVHLGFITLRNQKQRNDTGVAGVVDAHYWKEMGFLLYNGIGKHTHTKKKHWEGMCVRTPVSVHNPFGMLCDEGQQKTVTQWSQNMNVSDLQKSKSGKLNQRKNWDKIKTVDEGPKNRD